MTNGEALFVLFLIPYFLPAFIAYSRRHPQRAAIALTDLFLGWTCLGWIVALIWSATAINPALRR